jgi:hypothetical protein
MDDSVWSIVSELIDHGTDQSRYCGAENHIGPLGKQLPIERGVVITNTILIYCTVKRDVIKSSFMQHALYLSEGAGQPNEKYEEIREGG